MLSSTFDVGINLSTTEPLYIITTIYYHCYLTRNFKYFGRFEEIKHNNHPITNSLVFEIHLATPTVYCDFSTDAPQEKHQTVGTFDVLFKFLHGTHHETEFIYTISY
jgi:hypothetical protein